MKRAMARLKIYCEKKKSIISEISSANISIAVLLPGWDFKDVLKYPNFENLCMGLFKKTITVVDETLKTLKLIKAISMRLFLLKDQPKYQKYRTY
jgi:L1 cell adhesion molecule like protein